MNASLSQITQLVVIVIAALFSIISGLVFLQQKHTQLWFNQPNVLLGIGLIFFALLNFTAMSLNERIVDKWVAVPCLIIFFLSISFFVARSLLLFLRNFS
jgi:cytochrome bd-type quinol oxidase subunit 2